MTSISSNSLQVNSVNDYADIPLSPRSLCHGATMPLNRAIKKNPSFDLMKLVSSAEKILNVDGDYDDDDICISTPLSPKESKVSEQVPDIDFELVKMMLKDLNKNKNGSNASEPSYYSDEDRMKTPVSSSEESDGGIFSLPSSSDLSSSVERLLRPSKRPASKIVESHIRYKRSRSANDNSRMTEKLLPKPPSPPLFIKSLRSLKSESPSLSRHNKRISEFRSIMRSLSEDNNLQALTKKSCLLNNMECSTPSMDEVIEEGEDPELLTCHFCFTQFPTIDKFLAHLHVHSHETHPTDFFPGEWFENPKNGYSKDILGTECVVACFAFYCTCCEEVVPSIQMMNNHLRSSTHHDKFIKFQQRMTIKKNCTIEKLTSSDFEPLPQDGTIPHGVFYLEVIKDSAILMSSARVLLLGSIEAAQAFQYLTTHRSLIDSRVKGCKSITAVISNNSTFHQLQSMFSKNEAIASQVYDLVFICSSSNWKVESTTSWDDAFNSLIQPILKINPLCIVLVSPPLHSPTADNSLSRYLKVTLQPKTLRDLKKYLDPESPQIEWLADDNQPRLRSTSVEAFTTALMNAVTHSCCGVVAMTIQNQRVSSKYKFTVRS